jgi:hypothetical protein
VFRVRYVLSAVFLFAVAAIVGGQDPKQDARKFDLKLEKDKKFYQQMTNTVTQVIKVMGQDLTQAQDSTFYFKWTPVKQEAGDKWELTDEIEGVKMSIDISGNKISYDSTQGDGGPTAGNPGLMDFFKKLIGAKFTVTYDQKTSKVEKVDGVQAFLDGFGGAGSAQSDVLKKIMTEDAVKQMCDPTLGLMPDSPKKPGEKWEKKMTLNLGPIGSYNVTYNFTYVGPEKDLDKITVDTALTYTAPKVDPTTTGLLFRIKEGKLNTEGPPTAGIILYNPKLQRIESADIKIKLKGELTVTIGMTDTKVELLQEQTTKISTSETSLLSAKK